MKRHLKKKIFSLFLVGALMVPTITSAAVLDNGQNNTTIESTERAIDCPVYGGFNHNYSNKVYIRTETKTSTHSEYINGKYFDCTIVKTYQVFRKQCACGYYTASPYVWELVNEKHSLK